MKGLISVGESKNTYVYDRKDYVINVKKNIYIKDKKEYIKKDNKYIAIEDFIRKKKSKPLILSEKWKEKPCVQDCLLLDKICNLKTKRCISPPKAKNDNK
jgi:hypothetical protein